MMYFRPTPPICCHSWNPVFLIITPLPYHIKPDCLPRHRNAIAATTGTTPLPHDRNLSNIGAIPSATPRIAGSTSGHSLRILSHSFLLSGVGGQIGKFFEPVFPEENWFVLSL